MTSLLNTIKSPLYRQLRYFQLATTRRKVYINEDWKPGSYPKTMEERAAAAKKYGLLPEDYEPYPDDGLGYGDYPKLPIVSDFSKSHNNQFDMRALKRDFNEPIHADADFYYEEKYDGSVKHKYPPYQQFALFVAVVGGSYLVYELCNYIPYIHPVMPKQYSSSGKTHYTFEPAE